MTTVLSACFLVLGAIMIAIIMSTNTQELLKLCEGNRRVARFVVVILAVVGIASIFASVALRPPA